MSALGEIPAANRNARHAWINERATMRGDTAAWRYPYPGGASRDAPSDLLAIQAKRERHHTDIRYAKFVTSKGRGVDVDRARGFARCLGVASTLVQSDFDHIIRDLPGKDILPRGYEALPAVDY